MKKIIITGGVGFIGTNLTLSAIRRGYSVVIIDNFSRKGAEVNLACIAQDASLRCGKAIIERCDIRDSARVVEVIRRHRDAAGIFHLAGQVAVTTSIADPRDDLEINCIGTFNILEAVRRNQMDSLIVFSSTNKVYGALDSLECVELVSRYELCDYALGIDEAHTLDFHSPYGCSKGAADQYVRDYARIYGLNTVVLRQSCIYGVNQLGIEDQGWVAWFAIAAYFEQQITIFGNGKQVRDVLYIDDLISLYWKLLDHPQRCRGNTYNIGGGSDFTLSVLELVELLSRKLDREIHCAMSNEREGDQRVFVSNTNLVSRDFNWRPSTDPESGLDLLIQWISQNRNTLKKIGLLC